MGGRIPFEDAIKLILTELDTWVPDLYYRPLWRTMSTNRNARNLLYGWAVENYHYTGSVQQHITTALPRGEATGNSATHRLLVHMSEEWDHPHLFLAAAKAIAQASGSTENATLSRPLGATKATYDWLRAAGRIHPFVYKTCAATLERTAVRIEETKVFYHHVATVLGLPTEAVAPFIAHAETDESYEHLNSLAEFEDDFPYLDPHMVQVALTQARGFVDLYRLWQAQIVAHYKEFPPGTGALF
jgi:hypothetical protein